jgi:phenylalanyl-tRNA synthetase beta chain
MKRTLAARGLSELITYSFTKQDYAEAFKENCELVYLTNPISVDLSAMRPSLIPTLLSSVARAVNYGQANVGFCESGNAYRAPCEQEPCVAGVRLGSVGERNWLEKDRKVDIFDAKGDAFAVLDFCGIEERSVEAINSAPSYYHPFRSGTLLLNKKTIGYFGELHPKIGRLFDIQEKIVCFEIFVDRLPLQRAKISFRCGKAFPKINRDFAFVFPSQASVGNMTNAICKLDPLITKASIFDCFDLNAAQKSVGVTVELDAVDRTLTEDEAQAVSDKIIEYVKNKGGELRGK